MGAGVENDAGDRRRRHQQRARLPVGPEVFGRIDGDHALAFQGGRRIDLLDPGMRDLAAQEGGVDHARQFDIVDEQCPPGKEFLVFIALDRCAKKTRGHGAAARIVSAAFKTASTIF